MIANCERRSDSRGLAKSGDVDHFLALSWVQCLEFRTNVNGFRAEQPLNAYDTFVIVLPGPAGEGVAGRKGLLVLLPCDAARVRIGLSGNESNRVARQ